MRLAGPGGAARLAILRRMARAGCSAFAPAAGGTGGSAAAPAGPASRGPRLTNFNAGTVTVDPGAPAWAAPAGPGQGPKFAGTGRVGGPGLERTSQTRS